MSIRTQAFLAIAGCLLLVVCNYPASGALQRALLPKNPDHPNSCWLKDIQKAIPVGGALKSETKCELYNCDTHSEDEFLLTIEQCGAIAPPPGCFNKRDLSKPFPDCCGGEFICK